MFPSVENLLSDWVFTPIFLGSTAVLICALLLQFLHNLLGSGPAQPPHLVFKESAFSRFLLRRVPALRQPYTPPVWADALRLQTLLAAYWFRPTCKARFERQFLQLKDRGLIALDWALPPADQPYQTDNTKRGQPVLLLLPDAGTGALDLSGVCLEAVRRGLRAVVFNGRGCGGCPLVTPKLQPYGDPSDLRQAVKYIRTRSSARVTALGYGTGGDLLLAYLGEFGSSSAMAACAAVSPYYDPEMIIAEGRVNSVYNMISRLRFRRFLSCNSGALGKSAGDMESLLNASSVLEAERMLLGRLSPDVCPEQHYWERNAPLRDADDIATPLLCVSSLDDPYLGGCCHVIPYEIFKLYPNLLLAVSESGGHCAFLQDFWPVPQPSWADQLALSFLLATLEFASQEEKSSKSASR